MGWACREPSKDAKFREVARKTDLYTTISIDCKTDRTDHGVTRSHTMHKDAALIAHHHHTALLTALVIVAALTLLGCHEGVDVAVVGIPAETTVTVSVDSLSQEIASSPSKVYRYRGVGYARVLGLARSAFIHRNGTSGDGCAVAVGSVEYDGSDEVSIDLRPVDGCDKTPTPVEPVTAQPIAPSPQPQPQPQPMPMPPAMPTRTASPTLQDLCPLLVGSSSNTSRPGCPMPTYRRCPACANVSRRHPDGDGYDFAVSLPTQPQYLDFLIILPVEAATARQVVVDYSIVGRRRSGQSPSTLVCLAGTPQSPPARQRRTGDDDVLSRLRLSCRALVAVTSAWRVLRRVSPRPAGDAPTQIKATRPQGQIGVVDARTQNTLRLMLSGTVSLSEIATSASVTMEW
jgi:hypothetical protein